jgi:hypothetical protein
MQMQHFIACENSIINMSLQQQKNLSQEHTIFVILGTQKGAFELTGEWKLLDDSSIEAFYCIIVFAS